MRPVTPPLPDAHVVPPGDPPLPNANVAPKFSSELLIGPNAQQHLPHSPENRSAKKLLPKIFSKSEKEQRQIFDKAGKVIAKLGNSQQKIMDRVHVIHYTC